MWPVLDIQRVHGENEDPVRFTLNWGLHVVASADTVAGVSGKTPSPGWSPVNGRIGGTGHLTPNLGVGAATAVAALVDGQASGEPTSLVAVTAL